MDLYSIIDVLKNLEEGSMASAKKHSTGPSFTGYWVGKDSGTPGKHMVGAAESVEEQNMGPGTGGMEECGAPSSLEEKLRARWAETKRKAGLDEAGANNPPQGSTNDPKAQVAQATQVGQRNLTALKQAGVDLTTGVSQATQSAVKTATNPTAIPTSQDKKLSGALGNEIEQLATNTDPGKFQQVVNAIKQAKQQGGM